MEYIKQIGSKKGTIVFIHGNSSSSKVFDSVLVAEDIMYTKITFDLPGHGESPSGYNMLEDFSMASYVTLCSEFINYIEDDVLLVGNSLGGHIAIEVAPQIERLKGLVIFGTPPIKKPINLEEAYLPIKESQVFFMENPSQMDIENMANKALFNGEHTSQIISHFKQTNPLVRRAIANDVVNNALANEYDIFTNLAIPKYIIAGKQEPSVNPQYLKNVVRACHGSCELIELDACGHYPSIEQPELFIGAIKNIAESVFK